MPSVRITAYPAARLKQFEKRQRITWSTGESARPGDIQLFAVSETLGGANELKDDPRRNAVHSIWKVQTFAGEVEGSEDYPVQARFSRLVLLNMPVPKRDLVEAKLLKSRWPQSPSGKIFDRCSDIVLLAEVLARRNPMQEHAIKEALKV